MMKRTEIEIVDQNPLIPATAHNLLMTITNLSFFDSHYTGYTLSTNSNFIEFSNDMNWFYVIFSNEPFNSINPSRDSVASLKSSKAILFFLPYHLL